MIYDTMITNNISIIDSSGLNHLVLILTELKNTKNNKNNATASEISVIYCLFSIL